MSLEEVYRLDGTYLEGWGLSETLDGTPDGTCEAAVRPSPASWKGRGSRPPLPSLSFPVWTDGLGSWLLSFPDPEEGSGALP